MFLALVAMALPSVAAGAAGRPDGPAPAGGYWLVATDGGIFSFGDARFFGSTGDIRLNKPIVGMAATPSGAGYWLVASDGGLFSFGDAKFHGSAAERGAANRKIVALTPTPTGRGYWQASSSGDVFAFGDAGDLGSTGPVNVPVVGMAPTAAGGGYWVAGRDGGIFAFGDAQFHGSTGAIRLNQPIVGMAGRAPRPVGSRQAPSEPTPNEPGPAPADPAPTPAPPPPDSGPEPVTPRESPNGGTRTENLPRNGTTCGLPEKPKRTALPPETELIGEASGMAASQRYPGVYWMIRDSGHTPAVYPVRIDADGNASTREIPVFGATNGDWEEINYTIGPDGRGHLWIVESGQPSQAGTFRQIYEVLEPDPDSAAEAQLLNTYEYAWPENQNFNTEASFMNGKYLVLVTKSSPHARLFRFNSLAPGKVNVPTYIGELGNSKDVSVVRQSPDKKLLISASHQVVHLYRSTDGSGSLNSLLGRLPDCELMAFPDANVEAGDFSKPREMVFLDELKVTYRLKLAP